MLDFKFPSCHLLGKLRTQKKHWEGKYQLNFAVLLSFLFISIGVIPTANAAEAVSDTPIVDSLTPLANETEQWSIHAQSTYISQWKNNFNRPTMVKKAC